MVIALTTQNASYMFSFFFLVDSTFWHIFLSFILKYIFKPVLRSAFILCDLYFHIPLKRLTGQQWLLEKTEKKAKDLRPCQYLFRNQQIIRVQ